MARGYMISGFMLRRADPLTHSAGLQSRAGDSRLPMLLTSLRRGRERGAVALESRVLARVLARDEGRRRERENEEERRGKSDTFSRSKMNVLVNQGNIAGSLSVSLSSLVLQHRRFQLINESLYCSIRRWFPLSFSLSLSRCLLHLLSSRATAAAGDLSLFKVLNSFAAAIETPRAKRYGCTLFPRRRLLLSQRASLSANAQLSSALSCLSCLFGSRPAVAATERQTGD